MGPSPPAPTVRAAVVGAGYLGRFHAEKLDVLPHVELVAVVDVDVERARHVAAASHCEALTHHRALIGQVDAACVVVPTVQHHSVARDLLDAGIHVLVEKPVTATIEEARDLVNAARRNELIFQVGHLERFNPAVETLVDHVKQPSNIEAIRLSPFQNRGTDVDVVLDLMIHDLDLLLGLVREPIRAIDATGLKVRQSQLDVANARIEFVDGTRAQLTASRISQRRVRSMHVQEGEIRYAVDLDRRTLNRCRVRPKGERDPRDAPECIPVPAGDPLEAEIRAFVDCVRRGKQPRVDGIDGLRALELALAIRERITATAPDPQPLPGLQLAGATGAL